MDQNSQEHITEHFTVAEVLHSGKAQQLGISNIPSPEVFETIKKTVACMERVRAALCNHSIHVTSFFRSPEVNRLVGSKPTSQHITGEAVDFTCPEFGTPLEICKELIELKDLIRFDQLILEPTWVHISFPILSGKARGQVLSLLSTGGYANGLTDMKGHSL